MRIYKDYKKSTIYTFISQELFNIIKSSCEYIPSNCILFTLKTTYIISINRINIKILN